MPRRITCLHSAESNIGVFDAACDELGLGDEVTLRHEVRADLLADTEASGGLTPEIAHRTADALRALAADADAVLLTCSTLGPAVAGELAPVPVLRVDEALAQEAVLAGGRVVALCAVETTLEPTLALFQDAARATGAAVEVRLVPGAWAAFKAGDRDRYFAMVAAAADEAARDASRVALAQASMAGAAGHVTGPRPLTSPTVGLRAAVKAAGRGA